MPLPSFNGPGGIIGSPIIGIAKLGKLGNSGSRTVINPGDSATVGSTTTLSAVDVAAYVDRATIASVSSLLGSYLVESFTLHTVDYDRAPWNIAYSFDGSIPTMGSVGMFDDDHGHIPGT